MLTPYEFLVGLRYTRARRGSGRNGFVSFIAMVSMAGIALGVAALIVVLSVMNGFQDELRNRILAVASHIEIRGLNAGIGDWQAIARLAQGNPRVRAAAPYVLGQAMMSAGDVNRGALLRGIDPALEDTVADIGKHMRAGALSNFWKDATRRCRPRRRCVACGPSKCWSSYARRKRARWSRN